MMKKFAYSLSIVATALLLAACGPSEQTQHFTNEMSGLKVDLTFTYVDDKIVKEVSVNTIPYASLPVSKEQAKSFLGQLVTQFDEKKVDGLTHEMKYEDDKAIETVSIDFKKTSPEKLCQAYGDQFNDCSSNNLSMKKVTEELTKIGFTKADK